MRDAAPDLTPEATDPTGEAPREAIVVGGGVSGLMAARRLAQAGRRVTVLEADERVGGQVRTVDVAGRPIDTGAEAVHLASPAVRAVLDELGLAESKIASRPGRTWLVARSGLRRMPEGVGPAGPTRLGPVLTSRILSPLGLARAAAEPWIAKRHKETRDISVGDFIRTRFGREVAERFVDPMLGGLHSGDIDRLSLQAASPMLAGVARSGKSLTLSRKTRRAAPSTAPAAFVTWPEGLRRLPDTLAASDGVTVRTGATAVALHRTPTGTQVELEGGERLEADEVVLALPAARVADLLEAEVPAAAEQLRGIPMATVATVVLAWPRAAVADVSAFEGTGIMLPSSRVRVLKSATFVSTKWPQHDSEELFVARVSAGRSGDSVVADRDDETLVDDLLEDLRRLTGVTARPSHVLVTRWVEAMPQLEIGHADRVAAARSALADWPGLVLAGSTVDGVGLVSALASGERAAQSLTGVAHTG